MTRQPLISAVVDHRLGFRRMLLTISFVVFLYPLSMDGFGVNYSFLLLPLFFMAIDGKVRKPPEKFLYLIVLYTAILIIATIYQYEFHEEGLRRLVSFALFMSMFAYMFIKMDSEMIASFKDAIVLISVLLSLLSILIFVISGGSGLDSEEAKNLVGSQRYGFIYLVALWLVYFDQRPRNGIVRFAILVVLLAGLLLTFSRSSIIALLGSIALFVMAGSLKWFRRPNLRTLIHGVLSLLGFGMFIVLLNTFFPLAFDFFDARLVAYLLDPDVISEDLGNPSSSGGNRAFLLRATLDFILRNPLTGSGYLGVWVAFADQSASAHNQYLDVLFRTGVVGFLAYCYLLYLLAGYLYRNDRSLFWGLIAVLVYGIFNETFKESHGAFVLAFLLGIMSHVRRNASAEQVRRLSVPGLT